MHGFIEYDLKLKKKKHNGIFLPSNKVCKIFEQQNMIEKKKKTVVIVPNHQ